MQINNFVYVMHPEYGAVCVPPGDVPEWAIPLITNQSVIDSEPDVATKPGVGSLAPVTQGGLEGDSTVAADPVVDVDGDGEDPDPENVPIPPKGGRGSSATKWAEYAASKGFEIDADATAVEIREALEAEGIPTE